MRYSYKLLTAYGIEIKIHIAYLLLVLLVPLIVYLFFNFFAALAIMQFFLLLTLSVLLHELGRAYIVKRFRIYLKEIILLPFGGISIRKAMPENTTDERRVALSSITIYVVLVIILLPLILLLYNIDTLFRIHIYDFSPLLNFFQINVALLFFNIVPIYPMDGGRVFRSYLIQKYDFRKATKIAKWLTYIIAFVLIIIGFLLGLFLVILALFLYAGAHSKSRFDEAVRLFKIEDIEKKEREFEKYLRTKREMISKSREMQTKAELLLMKSRLGILPRLGFKFRDYFYHELTKGKFKTVREKLISILPLVIHIRNLIKLWLETKQVRKSLIFLLIASFCLSITWLLPTELMLIFSTAFLLSFSFGTFIIYYHTRSNRLFIISSIAAISWTLYLTLDILEPIINIDYWGYLFLEGVRGCLVSITGVLFFATIINNNEFFKKAKASMPLSSIPVIATLFTLGTLVQFYEIYILTAYKSDLNTIKFVLRYDVAYIIWFFAAMLIFATLIYLLYLGSISRFGRITTIKIISGTIIMLFLISFLGRGLVILALARTNTTPEDLNLRVGLHGSNITSLDPDEFDKLFHLEVTWSGIYPSRSEMANWSNIDWQLNYAMENEIDLYFLITPQPPKWFIENHSDSVMRDQWNNTFYWHDQDPNSKFQDRIWDLSFNDPEVVNAKINFTLEAVERYSNWSCIKYISVQNEPTYPVDFNNIRLASYDPVTENAFRTWVAKKFDFDLIELKNKTRLELLNWSELKAPRQSTDRLWNEWRQFRELSLINFVDDLTTAVKINTDKPVTVKIMGHYLARFETFQTGLSRRVIEQFFRFSDVISLDLYPITPADLQNALKFYKELAGNKPIIISEFNLALGPHLPGSGSMLYYELIMINDYAEAVIIYTRDNHYIYGLNLYEHTPVHMGLKLFRVHRDGGDVFSIYSEMLYVDILSIQNYYGIYVYACTVWSIPVIPWPILVLVLIPIPIADDNKRRKVKRINYAVVGVLLIIFFVISNII